MSPYPPPSLSARQTPTHPLKVTGSLNCRWSLPLSPPPLPPQPSPNSPILSQDFLLLCSLRFVHIFRIAIHGMPISRLPSDCRGHGFVFVSLFLNAGTYNGSQQIYVKLYFLSGIMQHREQTGFPSFTEDLTLKCGSLKMGRDMRWGKRKRAFHVEDLGEWRHGDMDMPCKCRSRNSLLGLDHAMFGRMGEEQKMRLERSPHS